MSTDGRSAPGGRRPMGSLEAAVLAQLWESPDGLTPREVLDRLDGDLAYTTVMTIMNRLWVKKLLTRTREGRAYRYAAARSEADVVADRMAGALKVARDRSATLSRFVDSLSPEDEAVLKRLLRRAR